MIQSIIVDLLFFIGLGFIGHGAWMISPAFAYILLGVLMLLFSVFLSGFNSKTRGIR